MSILDYYMAGQQAGRERKRQKAFDAASPFIAQAAAGDIGALKNAMTVPDLPVDTVMQLGQWAASASQAERDQAAAKAKAAADFTTNYLALPYDQQVGNWGAVQAFAQENGIEAPGAYNRDFLTYYALRSSNFLDTLKKTGPQLAGGGGGYPAAGMTTQPLPPQGGGMAPLAAVGRLESGGLAQPENATSPVGAMGQYQIMTKDAKTGTPGGTAAEIAAELGDQFALDMLNRGDVTGFEQYVRTPEVNQQYGDHYLKKMTAMFAAQAQQLGVVPEIIGAAAYNAGPGRVGEALARSGGTFEGFVAALPAETQKYLLGDPVAGRQGFLSLTGAGGAPPGGAAGPSAPAPAGGAPAGLRMVLGENGQPLSAGEGRVWFAPPDANGAPDWSRAVAKDAAGGAGGDPNLRLSGAQQGEFDALIAQGVGRNVALGLVSGRYKLQANPVTGAPQVIDLATFQEVPLVPVGGGAAPAGGTQGAAAPAPAAQPGAPAPETLWETAGDVTGIRPMLEEKWTEIGGQFGADGYPDTVRKRQGAVAATNDLIRALSINPRFPVGEIERLSQEVQINPSMWDSPVALRARMQAIDSYLQQRLVNERAAAVDPALPAETRQAAASAAKDITNFLQFLGVPQGGQGGQGAGAGKQPPRLSSDPAVSDAEYNALPSGTEFLDPNGVLRRKP